MANKPNNPSLWSKAKSLAKQKFDVYPSAYANGWAAKWYKGKGGTWRKAKEGMEVPYMEDGGKPEWLLEAQLKAQGYTGEALRNKMSTMMNGGMMFRERSSGDISIPNLTQFGVGGYFPRFMEDGGYTGTFSGNAYYKDGGEPNGSMALGQMSAVVDKLSKLRQFVGGDDNLDPWIASKLAVMDHSADAIYDYLSYGEDEEGGVEEEEAPMSEMEMQQMKNGGGIPERYKSKGFTKVGVKRQSNRPGKKWMVLAKKGDQYKIVHGGYKGMKDFTQHGSEKRRKNFWNRMGGKQSSKATDPFSPLYWHKRFGTWQEGGMTPEQGDMSQQQGGGAEQEQLMQLIQMYSQIAQIDPQQVIQQLQQMQPQEQQQAIQQMAQTVQQQSGGGGEQQPQQMMAYGGQMGGSYMPSIPAVSIYDLPIYQEDGQVTNARWHPEWEDQYSDSALLGQYDQEAADNAVVAEANAVALAESPVPQMPQFRIPQQPAYQGVSIVDYLVNAGGDSSYSSRKELAKELGISNYRGTASQNLQMLDILRGGKTTIPTGNVSAKSAAKKLESRSTGKAVSTPSVQEAPKAFWENNNVKKAYLDAHSGMTSQQYDAMLNKDKRTEVRESNKPTSKKAVAGRYDDKYFMKNVAPLNTDYSNQAAFSDAVLDFFPSATTAAVGPGVANSLLRGLMGASKLYPYGLRMIPEVVSRAREASRAIPYATRALPGFEIGGYMDPAWMKQGGIHINPANKGKFTASANRAGMGVQEFARHVLANKEDYSSTQVKRANFARNAAKWKKQDGGSIDVGSYVEDTPEMRAWLDANGYTYE